MEVELYKMTYKKRNNSNELKILGEEFVKNNKNKGFLIIDNKKKKLNSKYDISKNNFSQIKIQMVLNRNIFNKSCIFKNCESLESFTPFSIDEEINSKDVNENTDKENIEEEINSKDENENTDKENIDEEINSKDKNENTDKENIEEEEEESKDIEDHPLYQNIKSTFPNFSFISQKNEDINSSTTILYFYSKLKKLMNGNNYTIIK